MGYYSKIKNTEVSKSGSYFAEGNFHVEIMRIKEQESSTDSRCFFIIETKVLESDNEAIRPGAEKSQVIDLTQVMGLPNVKQFIASVSGIDTGEFDNEEINDQVEAYWSKQLDTKVEFEDICEMVASSDNPLEGVRIDLVCSTIITKGKGQPFTKHVWQPRDVNED